MTLGKPWPRQRPLCEGDQKSCWAWLPLGALPDSALPPTQAAGKVPSRNSCWALAIFPALSATLFLPFAPTTGTPTHLSTGKWPSSPRPVGGVGRAPDPQQLVPDCGRQSSSWRQWGGDRAKCRQAGILFLTVPPWWGVGVGSPPHGVWRLQPLPSAGGVCQLLWVLLGGGAGWLRDPFEACV